MEEVDQIKTRVVGVDIREVKTTYALVDIRGEIISMDYFMTMDYPDVSDYVTALSEKIITLVEENGGYEKVRSVGLSAPSGNFRTGCIENAANMPWKGVVPLAAMLRDRLGLAVALANDAHVTALGEKAFGRFEGLRSGVYQSRWSRQLYLHGRSSSSGREWLCRRSGTLLCGGRWSRVWLRAQRLSGDLLF